MDKKRVRYIDIAKGVAIICIVLLHIENGVFSPACNVFIGSFMISMFFVTTGWLDGYRAEPLPLRELVRKRWRQLGVPYLWWSGIIMAFDLVLYIAGYYDTYYICRETYKTLVLRGIGTLWFLPALFGGEMIWNCVRRSRYPIVTGILSVVATLVAFRLYGMAFGGATDSMTKIVEAPFRTLHNILGAWTSIAAGFLFHRLFVRLKGERLPHWAFLMLGVMVMAVAYWCANHWPVPFAWGLAAPVLGPMGILLISMAVENLRIADYFNYWGRNSFALMVTHYSIVIVLLEIFNRHITGEPYIHGYVAFAYFAACMVVEYFLCEFVTKRFPFTLGKTNK